MNAKQSAKANSHRAVKGVSEAHPTAWSDSTLYATPYADYTDLLGDLDEAIIQQTVNSESTNVAKNETRERITADVVMYARALQSIARLAGNRVGEDRYGKVNASVLQRASQDAFWGMAMPIAQAMDDVATAALVPYGITEAQIAATIADLAAFSHGRETALHEDEEGKRGTKTIAELLDRLDEIAERDLDVAVEFLKADHPDFYTEYIGAREIKDASFGTRAVTVSVTALIDGVVQPVGGAVAVIGPGGIEKTTGAGGKFYIQSLAAGTYTLSLSKPGFKAFAPLQFVVADGEMTTVNAVMEVENGGANGQ